eukprot:3081801-Amphidinium_carterae.3
MRTGSKTNACNFNSSRTVYPDSDDLNSYAGNTHVALLTTQIASLHLFRIPWQAHTDSIAARRQRARLRRRQPRLLFTHEGLVRPWSQLSAEVERDSTLLKESHS